MLLVIILTSSSLILFNFTPVDENVILCIRFHIYVTIMQDIVPMFKYIFFALSYATINLSSVFTVLIKEGGIFPMQSKLESSAYDLAKLNSKVSLSWEVSILSEVTIGRT